MRRPDSVSACVWGSGRRGPDSFWNGLKSTVGGDKF